MSYRALLVFIFVLASPSFAAATSHDVVGEYEVVVCGEDKPCEAVSADFDYRGSPSELINWIDTYDREYHADDLFLLRKLPLRQTGLFVESHIFQRKLEKFLEFEDNAKYYITRTHGQAEAASGYEITRADLEKVNDYLDWYMAYYEQTDGLRNDMIKVYAVLIPLLLMIGGFLGYRKYHHTTVKLPTKTRLR